VRDDDGILVDQGRERVDDFLSGGGTAARHDEYRLTLDLDRPVYTSRITVFRTDRASQP